MEYHGMAFGGMLHNNLIVAWYGASESISRLILNEDGSNVVIESLVPLELKIGYKSLDVHQAPNGNLMDIRYNEDSIAYYKPLEPPTTALGISTSFPRRGPSAGGNTLTIYGVNLKGITTTVTVGGRPCPTRSISATRIDCVLPGGPVGPVDIVVVKDGSESVFQDGYRYISGFMPSNFKIPKYTGK
jgi:IPT/TIG domain